MLRGQAEGPGSPPSPLLKHCVTLSRAFSSGPQFPKAMLSSRLIHYHHQSGQHDCGGLQCAGPSEKDTNGLGVINGACCSQLGGESLRPSSGTHVQF